MHMLGIVPLFGGITAWLTPIWLIGAGCFVGLAVLGIVYGIVRLVAPGAASVIKSSLREGFMFPVLGLASGFAAFALISLLLSVAKVGYLPLDDIFRSLERMPQSSTFETVFDVATLPPDERGTKKQEFQLDYRPAEMRSVEIKSDEDLTVQLRDISTYTPGALQLKIDLKPNEPWKWPNEKIKAESNPFVGRRATLYVNNPADKDAKLYVSGVTREEYPQVDVVPKTAIGLIAIVGLYVILQFVVPKIMAIASATAKEAISQPMYQIMLAIGAFLLIIFVYIPYYTLGEDVKMLKMVGLALITTLGVIVAAWTASVSVSEEIEGRTALTVLSKPLGRTQFLLGKFFGVIQSVSLLYIFLGALFLITVSGKVVYDTRETAMPDAVWTDCHEEIAGIVPGLVLSFLSMIVMTSISVAISTRLSMLPNLVISFSVYALGNLAPMLVQSKVNDQTGIVRFVGKLLATILPVLENFDIQAAVSANRAVPWEYLGWALLYCFLYSSVAMLLALVLFEDRDLA
jgi:ABC-type transport system involved in multi-copper enzyme maturation permease subunit